MSTAAYGWQRRKCASHGAWQRPAHGRAEIGSQGERSARGLQNQIWCWSQRPRAESGSQLGMVRGWLTPRALERRAGRLAHTGGSA